MLYWACFIINLAVCASQLTPFLRGTSGRRASVLSSLFCFFRERAPTTLGGNSPFALQKIAARSTRGQGFEEKEQRAFYTKVEAGQLIMAELKVGL